MDTANIVLENPNGQTQGESPTRNGQDSQTDFAGIVPTIPSPQGRLALPVVKSGDWKDDKKQKTANDAGQAAAQVITQPTEKDYRHATQKITEEIDKKIRLGRKMISKDPTSIYDIAEEDRDLANKLLKENAQYGASTVDELLANQSGADDLRTEVAGTKSQVKKLQEQLRADKILQLKTKHPDLQGELEQEFSTLYSDPRFSEESPERVLAVARAFLGGTGPTQPNANDVALELLKQQEGATSTMRGSTNPAQTRQESSKQKAIREQFGNAPGDDEKYLPKWFNEMYQG